MSRLKSFPRVPVRVDRALLADVRRACRSRSNTLAVESCLRQYLDTAVMAEELAALQHAVARVGPAALARRWWDARARPGAPASGMRRKQKPAARA